MLGQHQFHHYNLKSEFGENILKFVNHKELDEMSKSKFLAGKDYTIADIATFP